MFLKNMAIVSLGIAATVLWSERSLAQSALCLSCEQQHCADYYSSCTGEACRAIHGCIIGSQCATSYTALGCYCGTATDPMACLAGAANGPCRSVMEAYLPPGAVPMILQEPDPNSPLTQAINLGICAADVCEAPCGSPSPVPVLPVGAAVLLAAGLAAAALRGAHPGVR